MLVLNALLGLGLVPAPVFVAVFVGLGFWWGLPIRHRRVRRRPLQHGGLSLSAIFGATALVAAALAVLSFVVPPARSGLRHGRTAPSLR